MSAGSGVVRVGVLVALTCNDDVGGPHSGAVLNDTVTAAMFRTTHDAVQLDRFKLRIELDVVDACMIKQSVSRLTSALGDPFYVAVAGPGLYSLCGIASDLQSNRPQVHSLLLVYYR